MKKQLAIKFKGFLLLLVYAFSSSPSVLFHHHEVSSEKIDECKNAHHFAEDGTKCYHFSNAIDKCGLCDNHTVSPHSTQTLYTVGAGNIFSSNYNVTFSTYYFQVFSVISGRGPPLLSSFLS